MKMLKEMTGTKQGEGGTKKNSDQQTASAAPAEPLNTAVAADGDELDDVEDLGDPVVKGDEDTGPFRAADTVDEPKKRRGDKDNDEEIKDVSKSKLVTKAYESLTGLDKATLVERYAAITAAIEGKKLTESDIDLTEEVNTLLGNEKDLTEEFKKKATTILETKFNQMVREEKTRLNTLYEAQLAEEIESLNESTIAKLDSYLEYAASEWMKENQLAVDAGIKTEIAESFMKGLYELLETHSLHVPEEQEDVLSKISEEKTALENSHNDAIDTILEMRTALKELIRERVVNTVCDDLTDTEAAKIQELTEDLSFENADDLTEKVKTLREHYYPTQDGTKKSSDVLSEDILTTSQANADEKNANSGEKETPLSSDPSINALAQIMSKFTDKS
jgi:hypothetical protein